MLDRGLISSVWSRDGNARDVEEASASVAGGLSEEAFASGRGFGASALRAAAQRQRAEPEVRLARVRIVDERTLLSRFLDDGRLAIDNNASERALRTIAVGREAWLFAGSDDAAQSAAGSSA